MTARWGRNSRTMSSIVAKCRSISISCGASYTILVKPRSVGLELDPDAAGVPEHLGDGFVETEHEAALPAAGALREVMQAAAERDSSDMTSTWNGGRGFRLFMRRRKPERFRNSAPEMPSSLYTCSSATVQPLRVA
jgi:hypothetical protein